MIRLVLALALVLLNGCGRTQMADLADARAGALAYAQTADPQARALIADGVMAHLLAALDEFPLLPRDGLTAPEILADPAAYAEAGRDAQADPQPYVAPPNGERPPSVLDQVRAWGGTFLHWGMLVGGIGAGLVLLLWVCRVLPFLNGGGWLVRCLAGPLFAPLIRTAALWGSLSAAVGAGLTWLADWWWAVLIVALLAAGLAVWVLWRDVVAAWHRLVAWLRSRTAPVVDDEGHR